MLVEAKNWTRRVDSQEVAWFDWKMRMGAVSRAILVAARGVTGDIRRRKSAIDIIHTSNREGRRILLVTMHDLAAVTSTADIESTLAT
jgi:hypothetical protein